MHSLAFSWPFVLSALKVTDSTTSNCAEEDAKPASLQTKTNSIYPPIPASSFLILLTFQPTNIFRQQQLFTNISSLN